MVNRWVILSREDLEDFIRESSHNAVRDYINNEQIETADPDQDMGAQIAIPMRTLCRRAHVDAMLSSGGALMTAQMAKIITTKQQ